MTIEHEILFGFNVFRGKHIALNAPEHTYDDQLVEVRCTVEDKQILFDFFKVSTLCSYARGSAFFNHTLLYLICTVYSWAKLQCSVMSVSR